MTMEITAPVMGINRHRLSSDGDGVTSLVAFHGCPLRCRYCFNNKCHDPECGVRYFTPEALVEELSIDNLYFLATGGGVCFGGGEPLLRAEFIDAFCRIKPTGWHVTMETSLAVPRHSIESVVTYIHQLIVDVKDCNPTIYRRYTGSGNAIVIGNLRWLLGIEGMAEKILVRLPRIPDFNTRADVRNSRALLEEMGVLRFDEFEYSR